MSIIHNVFEKFKKVKAKDIRDLGIIMLLLPLGLIIKKVHKPIWLVSERKNEARDNGYWFFKYVREHHREKKIYYLIDKGCKDFEKINKYGNIIRYGSLKHYYYYILAELDISAHVGSTAPNWRICNLLERNKILKNKKVFLQHGITHNKVDFCSFYSTRANIIVCSAEKERNFLIEELNYPQQNVRLVGMCRFDGLNKDNLRRQILIMPTWRRNLKYNNNLSKEKNMEIFKRSEYFNSYNSLLRSKDLADLLKKEKVNLVFYPHFEIQPYLELFDIKTDYIKIANRNESDVQELLKESSALITDYSSIFFDFAYMLKPCIFYQFDYELFRKTNYCEGYFSYNKDSFGPVISTENELIEKIKSCIKNNFNMEEQYVKNVDMFFEYKDDRNCERVYKEISNIK